MLGIAANHLPRGSDIPGHGYLIAFDAFLTVLRVSSVIILLNFIFDISTEQRGGEQQAFIQNLPFGANLAGVGFLRFKIGAVGTVTAARLRKGEVVAARRLLGNGIVNIDIAVFRQVIQRPGFPVHQIARLGGVDGGDRRTFCHASRAGDGTASAAAAGGGTVIFSMIIIQTDPAVQLKITGDLQRIEGVNCEGIRLTIGVCAVARQAAGMNAAVRMINIYRG